MSRGLALTLLLTLWPGTQGCTTDVVDFPLKGQTADLYPGACKVTMDSKNFKRCTSCPAAGDAWTLSCEDLVCKYNPLDQGKAGCKICYWNAHPEELCKLCWNAQGTLYVNTCFDLDAGA